MSSTVEMYDDFPFLDLYRGWGIHDIPEYLTRLCIPVAPHPRRHTPVEAAGNDEQGHIEIDLEPNGG